jgi:hypothetical protein
LIEFLMSSGEEYLLFINKFLEFASEFVLVEFESLHKGIVFGLAGGLRVSGLRVMAVVEGDFESVVGGKGRRSVRGEVS